MVDVAVAGFVGADGEYDVAQVGVGGNFQWRMARSGAFGFSALARAFLEPLTNVRGESAKSRRGRPRSRDVVVDRSC